MRRTQETNQEEALSVGIEALSFLATDPQLLSRFLALSGLEAHELRLAAADPAFFAGLLDFFLGHEATLDAFCAQAGMQPERIVQARAALSERYGTIPG